MPDASELDLEQCAREPIQIPGRVQSHGVLLTYGADWRVLQASANAETVLARPPEALLGRASVEVLGAAGADAVVQALDLGPGDQLQTLVSFALPAQLGGAQVDAVVHRVDGLVVAELMHAGRRPRPVTFTDTYRRAQDSIRRLDASGSYDSLLEVAVTEVRRLTGFDRVMVYRFDAEFNGEVVAEARLPGLNSFLGLRYPATDIPAQARALYERSWLRLIADVHAEPAALVPTDNPLTGRPVDLSRAWLRAVSPVHIEYLRNMGVRASMSVSLLRDGKLRGLIACHHYSGPHAPDYETAVTVELLAQLISTRVIDRLQHEHDQRALARQATLTRLTARSQSATSLADRLVTGEPSLLDLVPADGVAIAIDGARGVAGQTLDDAACHALAALAEPQPKAWDKLDALPITVAAGELAGALVVPLTDGQYVAWFRREVAQYVDWGGDPHNKAILVVEPDGRTRLGPRRSFDRWREEVRGRSTPWTAEDLEAAALLRAELIDGLYTRARRDISEALSLQLSLLPDGLPALPGWEMAARYLPAEGGRVGGDWYDAFKTTGGLLAVVVGDVAGHGSGAAGTMGQLRNALRAFLVDAEDPAPALRRLDLMAATLMPDQFATVAAVLIDPHSGRARLASYGHPPALLSTASDTSMLSAPAHPPLGLADVAPAGESLELVIEPGTTLTLMTDGVFERRDEPADVGLECLRSAGGEGLAPEERCDALITGCRDPRSGDDATVLSVRRSG